MNDKKLKKVTLMEFQMLPRSDEELTLAYAECRTEVRAALTHLNAALRETVVGTRPRFQIQGAIRELELLDFHELP